MDMNMLDFDQNYSFGNLYCTESNEQVEQLNPQPPKLQDLQQNNYDYFHLEDEEEWDYGGKIVEQNEVEVKKEEKIQDYVEQNKNVFEEQVSESEIENKVEEECPDNPKVENSDDKSTNLIHKLVEKKQKVVLQSQKVEGRVMPSEQVETKNLPNYYCRSIIKYAKSKEFPDRVKEEQNKKLLKFDKKLKSSTLKTLRELLEDEEIRQIATEYFTSYQFLDDLLKSEKQQDVRPPIKYLNKMYSGCLDRSTLQCWKEA